MIGQFINAFFTRRGGNGDNGGKYYGLVKLAKCSVKRVACKPRPNWRNCVPQICKCRRDVKLFGRVVGTKNTHSYTILGLKDMIIKFPKGTSMEEMDRMQNCVEN